MDGNRESRGCESRGREGRADVSAEAEAFYTESLKVLKESGIPDRKSVV